MAIKIQGTTVIDDSRNATSLSDLSFNSLTLSGTPITSSAQELNHLSGTTSDVQTQIDALAKESATLNRTFSVNESLFIDLSSSLPSGQVPTVSVTKEVPQPNLTNNDWDVASDGTNYTLHDTAYSTTLTPSDASADGTFTLGAGSFAAEDVGKRIEGNGGVAFLTATDGSYAIDTPFNDTSTISNWSMFALDVESAAAGLTLNSLIVSNYDLSNASFTSQTFDISAESSDPFGLFFKSDGTKMYMTEINNGGIYQYQLSSPFDLSTGSFESFFSISKNNPHGENTPAGLFFRNDGLKMYVSGFDERYILEYNLSSAWDVSTSSYSGNFFDPNSQAFEPRDIYFKEDGLRMFICDNNSDSIYTYDLSIAWDVSSSTYTGFSKDVSSEGLTPSSLFFKNDGSSLFILNSNTNAVFEYNLSTNWEVSDASASYSGTSFSVDSEGILGTAVQGLYFDPLGTQMFVIFRNAEYVAKYNTGLIVKTTGANHTAITSTSTNTEFWVDINSMTADDASNDGSVYYAVSTDDRTTWKIIDDAEGAERAIVRNNAGTWEYNDATDYGSETWVAASENDEFYALEEAVNIDTARVVENFDLENASFDNVNFDLSNEDTGPRNLAFKLDGTKMYTLGISGDNVYQYTLSTAWDLNTVSYDSVSFSVGSEMGSPSGLSFKPDGTKMYISGEDTNNVFQYTLSTAWDLSTASYDGVSFDVTSEEGDPYAVDFKTDGTKMYITGNSDSVHQYTLSTAWDLSTASYDSVSFSIASEESAPKGLTFELDGTKMYMVGTGTDSVYQYSLSTAWDLSTASYDGVSFDLSSEADFPFGIAFKDDGTQMYIAGYYNDSVYQYSTVSFDLINRMDAAQLNAISDANHYTLGDDLDLAVTLTMPDSGSTSPTSDGVSINYDANALNQIATLGTDYDYDFPAADTVRFTALSAENFKIRIA